MADIFVPKTSMREALCLHFISLGANFGKVLALWAHRGGPWEPQEVHMGIHNSGSSIFLYDLGFFLFIKIIELLEVVGFILVIRFLLSLLPPSFSFLSSFLLAGYLERASAAKRGDAVVVLFYFSFFSYGWVPSGIYPGGPSGRFRDGVFQVTFRTDSGLEIQAPGTLQN